MAWASRTSLLITKQFSCASYKYQYLLLLIHNSAIHYWCQCIALLLGKEGNKSGQSNPPKKKWGKNYVSQALSFKCPLYFREACDDKMLSMNASKFDGIILSPKFRHVFVGKTLSYGWRLSSPQSSPHTIV